MAGALPLSHCDRWCNNCRDNEWLIDWLIIHCFTSRSRIFHLYGDVTITGEGLQNLGLCSALRAFEQGGIFYRATPAVTRGLGFSGLIRRTAPFSRLLRHTRGCGGSILPRILTGPQSVAFYDTQGDVEDLFLYNSLKIAWILLLWMQAVVLRCPNLVLGLGSAYP